MVRVKICGITNERDARAAAEAGADALGFIFAKSPRRVQPAVAGRIAAALGPWITKVGVFVNSPARGIERTMRLCGLDAAQLHGNEPASTARTLRAKGFRVIKAIRLPADLGAYKRYPADAFLLDTAMPGVYGGTGKTFDWKLLKKVRLPRPVIVSGGLGPGNVRRLLKVYTPYGVDASSGLESAPGKKDIPSMKAFIRYAKSA